MSQPSRKPGPFGPSRFPSQRRGPSPHGREEQFGSLNASLLYCPRCRVATPTRERLLLVLPTGNLYEYLCMQCGVSTGSKTDSQGPDVQVYRP
jgi:hypothetical protein